MSRYCGEDRDAKPCLDAADHWRQQALLSNGSVFSDASLWQLAHLEALDQYFVNQLAEGDDDFFEKLERQLEPTTLEVKRLAAEMLWIMLVYPNNIGPNRKRDNIATVWNWSGDSLPESPWLSDTVLHRHWQRGRWFIKGFHPDVLAGQASCLTLLFDMNRLFEAYVASELRQLAWKQGLRLREQGPQRYLARREDNHESLFLMKPDMAFLDLSNRILMIADSKWKLLDEREKKLRITQSDLYQMTSYAVRYGVTRMALVYPHQQWLTQPVTLRLQGASATLTVIPLDVTPSQGVVDFPWFTKGHGP